MCCEGERCARRDGAKVSHQRERYPGEEVFAEQNGVARIGGDAEHIAQHGYADLQADAGEEADQDRA